MSKTLKGFLEVYQPKSEDEKKFKEKHVTSKTKDANGNDDKLFQATNVKAIDRQKEAHGYNPGKDELVYEEMETLEEMDFRTAKELAAKFKNKGDNRKAALYIKLADALKRGDKTTAQGFMNQLKNLSEEQVDEMSDVQMKRREDIVKGMKRNVAGFKERYGKDAKSVMYATATKRAMGEEVEEIDELRDPNRAGVKVGEKVRITTPKAPARHTLDKIKGNIAFITKGDGSKLTTSLDRIKRIKAQSMSNEELDTSILELYINLDEENQQLLLDLLNQGLHEQVIEFAQSISETVDGNDN